MIAIEITQVTEKQYNDTRRWRCYEAALLMKKNEIRTDGKHPGPRPNTRLFSERSVVPQEFSSRLLEPTPKRQKFFF